MAGGGRDYRHAELEAGPHRLRPGRGSVGQHQRVYVGEQPWHVTGRRVSGRNSTRLGEPQLGDQRLGRARPRPRTLPLPAAARPAARRRAPEAARPAPCRAAPGRRRATGGAAPGSGERRTKPSGMKGAMVAATTTPSVSAVARVASASECTTTRSAARNSRETRNASMRLRSCGSTLCATPPPPGAVGGQRSDHRSVRRHLHRSDVREDHQVDVPDGAGRAHPAERAVPRQRAAVGSNGANSGSSTSVAPGRGVAGTAAATRRSPRRGRRRQAGKRALSCAGPRHL